MKKISITILLALVTVMILPVIATVSANQLVISGASTIQPIMEQVAELFEEAFGTKLAISGGGSGAGISDAISGKSDIGMVSRSLRDQEKQQLEHMLIGLDSIVFIVNERNPLNEITKEQLVNIYSGNYESWSELGWSDASIVLISKEIGRSTLDLFENYSGLKSPKRNEGNARIKENAIEIGANVEAAALVGGIPNAIGYLSVGTALSLQERGMPIKILKLDGIEATQENIINGKYPILRELNIVYRQDNEYKVSNFIDFILSNKVQQAVKLEGFVPVGEGEK